MMQAPAPTKQRGKTGAWSWLAPALRAVVGLQAALVFAQAILAGQFLSGNAGALSLHEMNGTEIITLVVLLQLVLAILVWRPGRGPIWPAALSAVLVPAVIFPLEFGFQGRLAFHIPLGVAIFGAVLFMLVVTRKIATGRV
ncbi:MAG: hypothetical protein ACRDZO_23030 [Egibacteraceae bacterium]